VPEEVYWRISSDAERFKFSISECARRILEEFYDAKTHEELGSPISWEEMDRLSEEAGRPDNPLRFRSAKEALAYFNGKHPS
jgi:Mn-dependent DtxR family transcriptional regulator